MLHPRQGGLRRAEPLRSLPGHPARHRSRRAGGVALGEAGPRVHRSPARRAAGAAQHTCSYGKPGGFVRRLTEGDGTWMGHILEHVAIEMQNVAGETGHLRQDPLARPTGTLSRRLPVRAGRRRPRGRPARPHPAPLAASRRAPARGRGTRGFRLRRGAGRVHPVRPAARARPQHHGAGAGGGRAADPLDPAQRPEPDPVRARPVSSSGSRPPSPAAPRTSPSSSPPTRKRPTASSATWACRCRSSGWCRRAEDAVGRGGADRLPGGGEALQRQSRPRHLDPPHQLGAGARRPSRSPGSTAAASSSRASSPARTTGCW